MAVFERMGQGGAMSIFGAAVASHGFVAALLAQQFPGRPVVLIAPGVKAQEYLQQDCETWVKKFQIAQRPLYYPAWEVMPHEAKLPHADVISERLETLLSLNRATPEQSLLIVTSSAALLQRTFGRSKISENSRHIKKGDQFDPLDLVEWLETQGYEPEAQVTQKGDLSLRGGILDVFPLTSPWPVRLEFFGNEIDSLRSFDPSTQLSHATIESVMLAPAGEFGFIKREVLADPQSPVTTLLDHLGAGAICLISEPAAAEVHAAEHSLQIAASPGFSLTWDEWHAAALQRGVTLVRLEEISPVLADEIEPFERTDTVQWSFQPLDAWRPISERLPEPAVAEAQRREFFGQLHRWLRQGLIVQVWCNNEGEKQRFGEIWREYGFEGSEDGGKSLAPALEIGALTRGFFHEDGHLVAVTDAEVFGRYKIQRPRRQRSAHAAATRSGLDIDFHELSEGDYVVHLQHGIGRYGGLKIVPLNSRDPSKGGQECLVLEYASSDPTQPAPKLYVPVSEAHLVSKYVGTGKARPALNTLGGKAWTKAKEQAESAVRDLASDLLGVQAARETLAGFSLPADTAWQREFESAFIYQETGDQIKAIDATKRDLESPRPMDRLICGDVGYGKTEVAIRAAFKTVMGGKQVAFLVPTTVLAQQHYNTLRERMADYPVRVEQLSRFRSKAEQKVIVRQIGEGSVDIVVGTHRLVQSDVQFKDLGLVIVDEEQRFGVLHKEKLKQMRKLVDVLTLSATPIPRTLYLALTGARDMSTIETPPLDRLPIETVVTQYDERIIRDAIQRELNRGGQVYFLHNRVFDIHSVAAKLAVLVPKARFAIGHGQMDSDELEEVMRSFVNGEADVLVSTTIIESGIDIPNANTIIIDRADRFGLSDLYQLRGRVGRYKHQAYAYLMLPRHAALLSDVRKRISAIKQYSSLGSGFKIAMRDLEIRGAGNLLGSQQSGHITAVGFDLYCQLLKQSVAALKGEKLPQRIDVQLRLDFLALSPGEEKLVAPPLAKKIISKEDPEILVPRETATYRTVSRPESKEELSGPTVRHPAYLPMDYIPESQHRVDVYRKLAQVTDKVSLEKVCSEVRDRFGKMPPSVELLMAVQELRLIAAGVDVSEIETRGNKLMITRRGDLVMLGGLFPRLTKKEAKARVNEIRKLLFALVAPPAVAPPPKPDAKPAPPKKSARDS